MMFEMQRQAALGLLSLAAQQQGLQSVEVLGGGRFGGRDNCDPFRRRINELERDLRRCNVQLAQCRQDERQCQRQLRDCREELRQCRLLVAFLLRRR